MPNSSFFRNFFVSSLMLYSFSLLTSTSVYFVGSEPTIIFITITITINTALIITLYEPFFRYFLFMESLILCFNGFFSFTFFSSLWAFFSFHFSVIFIFAASLIPASLNYRLYCQEHAYNYHRQKIYDSFYIKYGIGKIVKMTAQIKYIQHFLDSTGKETGIDYINNCQCNLSCYTDYC